ncbi:MAG TPA: DNA polymerase III subunit gamma and tau [Dermatophilaceae bacterium]|nr:DNA polymerase III subunit gamma and tau [Dermatophilaceae bacterium]
MSTALYRRYRPETFADVIGQEHVTEPLMQALRTGRVGHAYLFSGPRGCGKTTSARILARCLNCEQGPTPTPCGTCDSCVALARGGSGSVDVIEIDAASHGGVDDARDLRERASYGPAQSRFKVYIIDEAHMVTPQGFNALLKIVEEPPEHVKFVFATTEPEKVIGTIRSRTHHYPFRLVPPAKLTAYLEQLSAQEGVAVAPGVLGFVTRAGGGSVRDSLSVLDQLIAGSGDEGVTYEGAAALLGFTSVELLDATIDALAARDAGAVFAQVDKVIESGQDPRRFAMDLLERLRDLIIVAAVPDGAAQVLRGVPEDQLDRMRGQQSRFGPGTLSRAADIVNAGITEMTGATSPRLQLELICARILLPGASGESGYAARLDRIERHLDAGGGVPAGPRPSMPAPPAQAPAAQAPPAQAPAAAQAPPAQAPAAAVVPEAAPVQAPVPAQAAAPVPAAPAANPAAPPTSAGGFDVDAIRRVWPEVLGRIFTMRRATWTFVSEHAQVIDYDGQRLVLGISTTGLTQTFRAGNHAELIRQALIDQIGLDARVEGVPMPAGGGIPSGSGGEGPSAAPRGSSPAPASSQAAAPTPTPTPVAQAAPQASTPAPAPAPRSAPAPTPAPEPDIPLPPEPPEAGFEPPPDPADHRPPTNHADHAHSVRAELARAKEATRRTMDERHHRSDPAPAPRATSPQSDLGAASLDDEVVQEGAEIGQAVIERMLGGTVLGDTPT